ncbi:MAG: class I SAM-dependent methyltransferase [Alteraurantiacibacter sp.]
MGDAATLAFYEKHAPHLTLSTGCAPSRDLDSFLDPLAAGERVLELGCGTGRDAARMAERGFDVDATDGAAAMVRKANKCFGIGARLMRFDELQAESAYDAVWSHASLLHVARADLPDILDRIHRALRPGGWHYASYKLGKGEGRCTFGRLHNLPDRNWIAARYRKTGFTVVDSRIWEGEGANGTVGDWIALTMRRSEP